MNLIANCDTETGEINGCSEGSKEYEHEKAHLEFSKKYGWIQWISQMAEFFTLIFLAITPFIDYFKYFSIGTISLMLFIFIYEEIWCNYQSENKEKSI